MKILNKLMSLNEKSKIFLIVIVNLEKILWNQIDSIRSKIKIFQQSISVLLDNFKNFRLINYKLLIQKKFKHFEKADLDRYNEI